MIHDLPKTLDSMHLLLEKTFPLPQRFRNGLPRDISELSQLLTNQRSGRTLSYLSRRNYLSAYLHYFLPWNIYRLCLLLPYFDLHAAQNSVPETPCVITDLGSGPLTFASALWISRPDLRNIPIEINCIDRSGPALEAGKKFFMSLCGTEPSPWKINLIKKEIDFRKENQGGGQTEKKVSVLCAINIFNEVYEKIPHSDTAGLKQAAARAAKLMRSITDENSLILTVEPGVPRCGKFISLLRDELLKLNHQPVSPCTHTGICPCLSAGKWCHFAYNTKNASKELLKLSKSVNLPKERLVLSYLLTASGAFLNQPPLSTDTARVISDAFPLSSGAVFGRYVCSAQGLVLVKGEKNLVEKAVSSSLIKVKINKNERDEKSGAYIGVIK